MMALQHLSKRDFINLFKFIFINYPREKEFFCAISAPRIFFKKKLEICVSLLYNYSTRIALFKL